jgi:predicted GNAT family N-acyltransferase
MNLGKQLQTSTVNSNSEDKGEARSAPFYARPLRDTELLQMMELTRENLAASVAGIDIVRRVVEQNLESFWGLFRRRTGEEDHLTGYVGMLFLNSEGIAALKAGRFDASDPSPAHLTGTNADLEAIYLWCIVAPKFGKLAIDMVAKTMGPSYAGLPLYAGAASEAGLRTILGFGFKALDEARSGLGGLFILERSAGRSGEPQPRRKNPWSSRFRTVIASTGEDVEKAFAIRAAVFLVEQNCPYAEEFDGNDRTATHVVGYVDDEPVGTLRIRYFADFAKIERLAVLPRFRRTLIAKELVDTAFNFCRRKGYRKVYGQAEKHLVRFWSRFGFEVLPKNYNLIFSDHEFVEMSGDLDPHPNPITIHSDPYLIVRPEGHWDGPGVLDKSAIRPATNPH